MRIDIWSDVVCPFCYIGKRRLEHALAGFPHRDEVRVTWHSFELDPEAGAVDERPLPELVAAKYGLSREDAVAAQEQLAANAAGEGLDFRWDIARPVNTFDAHRVLHLARIRGVGEAAEERFFRGYFTEGRTLSDHATLVELAVEAGLAEPEVQAVLGSDAYAADVRADEARAQAYGIRGVPFFVLDEAYGISGAQPREVFEQTLVKAWGATHPLEVVGGGASCADGSCAV